MIELNEKAGTYAEKNVINVLKEAFAKVYADGYRDGYKDREEEIPIELRGDQTEYVDLGLPSGTLWANNYETDDKEVLYLPYEKAAKYNLPTEEQWDELLTVCKLIGDTSSSGLTFYGVNCIGPNGNSIKLKSKGYLEDSKNVGAINFGGGRVYFWIQDNEEGIEKKAICINSWKRNDAGIDVVKKVFSGYKLPLRLVKQK